MSLPDNIQIKDKEYRNDPDTYTLTRDHLLDIKENGDGVNDIELEFEDPSFYFNAELRTDFVTGLFGIDLFAFNEATESY